MLQFNEDEKGVVTCAFCTQIVNELVQLVENGTVTDEQLIDYAINVCASLNIFSNPDVVCGGIAEIILVTFAKMRFIIVLFD